MKKFLLALILALPFLSACKNCAVDQVLSQGMASGVTTLGRCTNPAAVKTWTDKVLGAKDVCSATADGAEKSVKSTGGVIASIVCPVVVNAVVSFAGTEVPHELTDPAPNGGGCDPSIAEGGLAYLLTTACNAIPASPAPKN